MDLTLLSLSIKVFEFEFSLFCEFRFVFVLFLLNFSSVCRIRNLECNGFYDSSFSMLRPIWILCLP